jgi:GrpB-like predicted nucleotidyltransferase (UPF0157 family)
VTEPAVYLLGGPATPAKSAVARVLAGFGVVVEDDGPEELLGDRRTAIRSRPCHVIVLDGPANTPRVGIWLDTTGRTPDEIVEEILARTATTLWPLVVADYDERWPAYFEELAQPVRAALADIGAEIEHVGSTSVPGLAAKPIVDVDVVVASTEDVPAAIERLRSLGYVYQGDKGIEGREAFMWPPGSRRHHLYVVVRGSPPHVDHVEFRDYLRDHPEAARDYGALKKELAERHGDDPLAYGEAKTEFVTGVLLAARA